MHKMNYIFAAVFAAAIVLGGVDVFTAVNKKGFDTVDTDKRGIDTVDNDNVDTKNINIVRRGRKIQVDGFLLEWRGADANVWPGARWLWDAVSTAEGIAGYISLPAGGIDTRGNVDNNLGINTDNKIINDTVGNTVNTVDIVDIDNTDISIDTSSNTSSHQNWVFTLCAVNTGRSLKISLPGQPSGEYFAYDKGEFDAGGPLTAEWVVPWEFFDDGEDSSEYKLSITASGGGGALHPLVLTVEVPIEPQGPSGLVTRLAMIVLIAALTVALVLIRRRQMNEKGL